MALTPLLVLTLFAVPGSASEYAKQITGRTASGEITSIDPIGALRAEIQELRIKQSLLDQQIEVCKLSVEGVADEKKLLDEQIFAFYHELACFDEMLLIYDQWLQSYEQKLVELDQSISVSRQKLAVRLRQTHEEGLPKLLELLGSATDLLSLFIAVERQNQLTAYDSKLMEELNDLYYQQKDLKNGVIRVKELRYQTAVEQAERARAFNERLQIVGGFQWDLESDVHRFSYFIQQSQVGVQYADISIQAEVDSFIASLNDEMSETIEKQRQEKVALFNDSIKALMENGTLQQGSEFSLSGSKYIIPLHLEKKRTPVITSVMGYCTYQIDGKVLSDYHGGIDLAATYGTAVVASASGVVVSTGWQQGYGNYVVLWHPDGSLTRYAHLAEITASVGEYLLQGEQLGKAGTSGNSKGIGCHFELWKDGKRVDPTSVLVFSAGE